MDTNFSSQLTNNERTMRVWAKRKTQFWIRPRIQKHN